MHRPRCLGERRGRAIARPDAEENLRDANSDAAPKKERGREKEIANADAKSKKILDASGERIALSIANLFAKKETHAFSGRGIAIAYFEKEKNFADAVAERVATSKEKSFPIASTVRNIDRITIRAGIAVTNAIRHTASIAISNA